MGAKRNTKSKVELTSEQEGVINTALRGRNVWVEACIGSGKTTTIQELCNRIGAGKKVLYLTYNKLLKVDAKSKIKNKNVEVTNYHGYAFKYLIRMGKKVATGSLISSFLEEQPDIPIYDYIIVDEYQDINTEISEMITYIDEYSNGKAVKVVVGDICQKIYDWSTLDVQEYVNNLLGENTAKLEMTQCFRLGKELADKLSSIWGKKIEGVNWCSSVKTMDKEKVIEYLAAQDPSEVLCMGGRSGSMAEALNRLEREYPEIYNKKTTYASIKDSDSGVEPNKNSAIFTTFDSAKGMEKPIAVVFDWDLSYWESRIAKPNVKSDILRNVFCVGASRGKREIIFVEGSSRLMEVGDFTGKGVDAGEYYISDMFSFKYSEMVDECFKMLSLEKLSSEDEANIEVDQRDDLIDLSPAAGIYAQADYFKNYSIEKDIEALVEKYRDRDFYIHYVLKSISNKIKRMRGVSEEERNRQELIDKILLIVATQTYQNRYVEQVTKRIIGNEAKKQINSRLAEHLRDDCEVQVGCNINMSGKILKGVADAVQDGVVYELKFVSELSHEHFLQCACYAIAMGLDYGILWNIRTNERWKVSIINREQFKNQVLDTVLMIKPKK
jgi:hypothetical protein